MTVEDHTPTWGRIGFVFWFDCSCGHAGRLWACKDLAQAERLCYEPHLASVSVPADNNPAASAA